MTDVSINDENILYYDDVNNPATPAIPMAEAPESGTMTAYIGDACELTIQGIGSENGTASYVCPPTQG